jgi:DNA-binding NarL/FixJ family response regulator
VLILLDLNLPDMSGTSILSRIKEDPKLHAPVVVRPPTTVWNQRCYDLGCNVYITKPVNYESFAEAIRQLGLFLSVIQVPEQGADAAFGIPHPLSTMMKAVSSGQASSRTAGAAR